MPRFYCPQPLVQGATIALPAAVAHHARVVRLQPGAPLTLFNGEGGEWSAQLASLDKHGASAVLLAHAARESELPYAITLAQALPEAAKMDWIIEKAVELGVAAVQPLAAQRSVVKLSAERAEKRHAHWHGVIVAASEQSGRNRVTTLAPLARLHDWLGAPRAQTVLLSPRATQSLSQWAAATASCALALVVGPEGGLTLEEEQAVVVAGGLALSMGPRILRTETCALAALAMLAAHWGEV
ncbi:16S rRNA (uracil(1498)-N(3))-methyltransferase [Massilia sp. PWRC2]|uniref:16S rRNA (uracil(1498)-N(3))-methyltransferase n=1 Tax=Massilia sp. PWRC2 TaxID=2804626 RepID=UPI003CEFCB45